MKQKNAILLITDHNRISKILILRFYFELRHKILFLFCFTTRAWDFVELVYYVSLGYFKGFFTFLTIHGANCTYK